MNTKGFTTVEVLVCFVIVSIVMMTMFSTISSFNDKRIQESNRAKIYEFKNEVTNVIQEDIVKRGILFVNITTSGSLVPQAGVPIGKTYSMDITFGDGTQKTLEVYQRFTKTEYRVQGTPDESDSFAIYYGPSNNMIEYELPNLGSTSGSYVGSEFKAADLTGSCDGECKTALDLQINNVEMYVTDEADPEVKGHVLVIYIGFYHPEFGTKYAIDIVAPMNYQASLVESGDKFATNDSTQYSNNSIYYPDPESGT